MNQAEVESDGKRIFKCGDCGKGFKGKMNLAQHIREVHLATRSFNCANCEMVFKSKANLVKHVKFVHPSEEESPKSLCPHCGKTFRHLVQHIKTVHNKEEEAAHDCQVCNKKFTYARDLARHTRVHTGEKPFVCDQCPEAFRRADRLKQHVRNSHQTDNVFKCDVCSKVFVQKTQLLKHGKVHENKEKKNPKKNKNAASSSSLTDPLATVTTEFQFEHVVIKQEVIEALPASIKEPKDVQINLEEVLFVWNDGEKQRG